MTTPNAHKYISFEVCLHWIQFEKSLKWIISWRINPDWNGETIIWCVLYSSSFFFIIIHFSRDADELRSSFAFLILILICAKPWNWCSIFFVECLAFRISSFIQWTERTSHRPFSDVSSQGEFNFFRKTAIARIAAVIYPSMRSICILYKSILINSNNKFRCHQCVRVVWTCSLCKTKVNGNNSIELIIESLY